MLNREHYDVVVVGGGHAGTEAALAAARIGAKTLLLTYNIDTLGQMSCNPAIGGIGKGHLVKEIDALGGVMARAIDQSGIQFRKLNVRKGAAVRATRAQADRVLYKQAIRGFLERQDNLLIVQQAVEDILLENEQVVGVLTQLGLRFYCKALVLTVGTFLAGKIHVGDQQSVGGRAGDPAAVGLAQKLREMPFCTGRLKTGTPPRIDGRTIDYAKLLIQAGDVPAPTFSFMPPVSLPQQLPCYIARTNEKTHDIIRNNLQQSAMFSGAIVGEGPRYCPSIEDKVVRFADKSSHQIFIEPEGLSTSEIYPNGISTSLPFAVQLEFVRSMVGLEKAHITRPGYAIEYDFFDPRGLNYSLETKAISGLFFAGQINGTTGYEEAGAQGLIAGLNAALLAQGKQAWYPRRDQAYIGVLIDDLITRGTEEPYRMFTSRAEYRLLLREDNADLRLTETAYTLGLIDEHRWHCFNVKREAIEKETASLRDLWIHPESKHAQAVEHLLSDPIKQEVNALDLLRRPEISYCDLKVIHQFSQQVVAEQVEIQTKYAGYIERQAAEIAKLQRHEQTKLPKKLNYAEIPGLSNEVVQRLQEVQPETIMQATRIPGVTAAAISILLIHLKKHNVLA